MQLFTRVLQDEWLDKRGSYASGADARHGVQSKPMQAAGRESYFVCRQSAYEPRP